MSTPAEPEQEQYKNEWGHTTEDYLDAWNELPEEVVGVESDGELYKYLTRMVAQYLFSQGHPDPQYPGHYLMATRTMVLAALRFLMLEGFIETTEKGTRKLQGEEVAPPPERPESGSGGYV